MKWAVILHVDRKRTRVIVLCIAGATICIAGFTGWYWQRGQRMELPLFVRPQPVSMDEVSVLKVGFVTDWEYGHRKRMKHKLTLQAPYELEQVVKYLNDVFVPDIVVGGGDYIESTGVPPEKAKAQLAVADALFQGLTAPRLYALGNHDLRSLTKSEVREVLGLEDNHAIRDIGEWRLIVLDTNFNQDGSDRSAKQYVTGFVSRDELRWLAEALQTDRPVIMFSHHAPIQSPNVAGVFAVNIVNAGEVRCVLEEAGNVVAVVSGHSPFGYSEERNGIQYFVVDTLVNEPALGSFATLELRYAKRTREAEILFRRPGQNQRSFEMVDWSFDRRENERDGLPESFPDEAIPAVVPDTTENDT